MAEHNGKAVELRYHLERLRRRLELEPNSYEQVLIEWQILATENLIRRAEGDGDAEQANAPTRFPDAGSRCLIRNIAWTPKRCGHSRASVSRSTHDLRSHNMEKDDVGHR